MVLGRINKAVVEGGRCLKTEVKKRAQGREEKRIKERRESRRGQRGRGDSRTNRMPPSSAPPEPNNCGKLIRRSTEP